MFSKYFHFVTIISVSMTLISIKLVEYNSISLEIIIDSIIYLDFDLNFLKALYVGIQLGCINDRNTAMHFVKILALFNVITLFANIFLSRTKHIIKVDGS